MRKLWFPVVVLLGLPAPSPAQTILDASRRIDWSQAGVPGGIPDRTAVCATLNPGATASQINSAIAACPSDGVVFLNAGTYNLSGGITFDGQDNVTLRGAGPGRTILRFTAHDSCGGVAANVCIQGAAVGSSPPASNIHNWTGGFAKGTTQITLSSASGISVGSVIVLDQLDDATDTGGVYISCVPAVASDNCPSTRTTRSQQQMVRVTSISGNQLTISPGLHMPNWRASQQPQVWWWGESGEMNGVEDMTLDHTNSTETTGIGFRNAYRSWVKNVKSLNANRSAVWVYRSARIEVRDSYFYGTKNAAILSYGVESFMTSDTLVVNNIFQHISRPIMMGPAAGSVYAYNFMTDMYYTTPATWLNGSINGSHDSGTGMNLFEGNVGTAFLMDLYHGTGALPTLFRNRLTGQEPGKTQNTSVVNIWGFNRLANIVGNVLGTSGYHTKYENSRVPPGTSGSPDRSIYLLGYTGVNESTPTGYDALLAPSILRWGNYDYATGQARWLASEIPSGHAVPGQVLPASFFLSARPGWWGTMAWPAIGPDVTGGQDPAGRAHKIPAQVCFDTTARASDGTLAFNPDQCYPTAPPPPPDTAAPSVPGSVNATATSYSQIAVTWAAATDNVGVTAYRVFRCSGGACTPAAQIGTSATTSFADAGLSAVTSYTYAVRAVDAANNVSGLSAVASAVTPALPPPTAGVIAHYRFSEGSGSTAADLSPHHNTATLNGATWAAAGGIGSALAFDGAASFVEAADIDPISPALDATFHAWVRLSSAPPDLASVFNKWSQTADDEYLVGINPNRTLYFAWQTTGGATWGTPAYNHASGVAQIPLNTLTHIAVVRSGTSLRFYVNGTLDVSLTTAMDANPFRNGAATIRLGGQGRGARNRFLQGIVDEALIYNRALTQAEVQNAVNAGLGRPPSAPLNIRILR